MSFKWFLKNQAQRNINPSAVIITEANSTVDQSGFLAIIIIYH